MMVPWALRGQSPPDLIDTGVCSLLRSTWESARFLPFGLGSGPSSEMPEDDRIAVAKLSHQRQAPSHGLDERPT
jgi:hypothetical protein